MKTVLLVIDVQNEIVTDKLHNGRSVIENIMELITFCRRKDIEVIYVRHDDGTGSIMTKGTWGWEIYEKIAPMEHEKIFDKTKNSVFKETGLREYLCSNGIKDVIMTGLQTEYCMDTSVKAGFEHGFRIIIPEGTISTIDNEYFTAKQMNDFFIYAIWKNRFAKVLPLEEVKILLN